MNYWIENWSAWVGAFLVIAIYSYLWKDNPLYRITMEVFIGVNVGYQVIIQWRDILYPQWWIPMIDGFHALFLGGSGSPWRALWAVAGLLGLCWYFQMSRKYMWLSRIVMGVIIGITAGVTIKSQLGTNLPQLTDSFRQLAPSVVGPQPRFLFSLPPSDVSPAIDANVGFFAGHGQLACVDTLGGVPLWRQAVSATGDMVRLGDQVVVPTPAGNRALEVSTGQPSAISTTAGLWHDASSLFWQGLKITDIAGSPVEYSDPTRHLVIASTRIGIQAFEIPGGKPVWRSAAQGVTGVDISRDVLVYVEGTSFVTADALTGNTLGRFRLPGIAAGPPIVAGFSDPLEDAQYAIVPLQDQRLVALQIASNLGLNLRAGDILWSTRLAFPPKFGKCIDGHSFITGPAGGAAFEVPHPTKRLLWTDYVDNWVFVLTLVSVMSYFFFSFRHKSSVVEKTSLLGRYMLMIGFGAFFGNTVMTRMSYLIDRLMFLADEWLRPFFHHFF